MALPEVFRKRSSNMAIEQRGGVPLENQTIVRQHRVMSPQARTNQPLLGKDLNDEDNESGE